jgi:hypothetical protein
MLMVQFKLLITNKTNHHAVCEQGDTANPQMCKLEEKMQPPTTTPACCTWFASASPCG